MTLCLQNHHLKFVIIIFHSITFTCSAFSQTNEKPGYLLVKTDSAGIEIQLDKKLLGRTPLPIISLAPGEYQVTALHPQRHFWGNFDWQDQIKILPNDTVVVMPRLTTFFHLQTQPFNAEVFLNDEYQGETPLSITTDLKDSRWLFIKKEGYHDYVVDLRQLKSNFLNVTLTANQQASSLNNLEKNHKKLTSRYQALTYSFWGLSILSGLTTVYLKDHADQRYSQYLQAGSLRTMNKYYNDARRFDYYSYVSLAVVQGCFLLSFYFLMKSMD